MTRNSRPFYPATTVQGYTYEGKVVGGGSCTIVYVTLRFFTGQFKWANFFRNCTNCKIIWYIIYHLYFIPRPLFVFICIAVFHKILKTNTYAIHNDNLKCGTSCEGYINLTNPILPLFKYSTYLGGGWMDGNEVHKNEEECNAL